MRARYIPDFSEVRGHAAVIPAIESAIVDHFRATRAGEQSPLLLFTGPPGTGKTMIARRIPGLFPKLDEHDACWLRAEYDGLFVDAPNTFTVERPFRAPHHTISTRGLVGLPYWRPEAATPMCRCKQLINGSCLFHRLPRAIVSFIGEVQLARFGILFLDELIEFSRAAIEALCAALGDMTPRTRPMLVAATNACACGWLGSSARVCTCTPSSIQRYTERLRRAISTLGPARTVTIESLTPTAVFHDPPCEDSATIRARIESAVQS